MSYEVNKFVAECIKQVEGMLDNLKAKDLEIEKLKNDLQKYKSLEETLNKAILMAEDTASGMRRMASDESTRIINEAKRNASRIVNEALLQTEKLENDKHILQENLDKIREAEEEIERLEKYVSKLDIYLDFEKSVVSIQNLKES